MPDAYPLETLMICLSFVPNLLVATAIALPGNAPVGIDYIAYDAAHHRVWVPTGNTGKVAVIDTMTRTVTSIDGFVTKPSATAGRPRMGPSSVTIGDDVAWVGNRGDDSICAFYLETLKKKSCVSLPAMPDGIQLVRSRGEVWVSTPGNQSMVIVDVRSRPARIARTIKLAGDPEGYAVDEKRGVYYTNLEDKDQTVAIDLASHTVVATWSSGCGGDGPRGLALDEANHHLLVGCTDGAIAVDLGPAHTVLSRIKTGKGVDNVDYHATKKRLYIASREDGMLTVADVGTNGALTVHAKGATAKGTRNAVADAAGTAYVPDAIGGKLLVVEDDGK